MRKCFRTRAWRGITIPRQTLTVRHIKEKIKVEKREDVLTDTSFVYLE